MQELKYCSLLNMVNRNTHNMWQRVDQQLPPGEHLRTNQELQTQVQCLVEDSMSTFDYQNNKSRNSDGSVEDV